MANRKRSFADGDLKCARCGSVIGRKIYQNQILELESGLLVYNWIRGECNKQLSSGRPCSAVFEWIAPILQRVAGELSPDTIHDVLSAAKAQMTDSSKRIKTRQIAT
jgi:hypothetical protein